MLGVPVAVCADVFAAAVALHQGGGGQIVTLNAEMTMAARADRALGEAIADAQLVIPDGAGVVWALSARAGACAVAPALSWPGACSSTPPRCSGGWRWWAPAPR